MRYQVCNFISNVMYLLCIYLYYFYIFIHYRIFLGFVYFIVNVNNTITSYRLSFIVFILQDIRERVMDIYHYLINEISGKTGEEIVECYVYEKDYIRYNFHICMICMYKIYIIICIYENK